MEIAQAIRNRLRRVNNCHGGSDHKFVEMCKKITEIAETIEKKNGQIDDQVLTKINDLQSEPCLRINEVTQDQRIQIPRWTVHGGVSREKKVASIFWLNLVFSIRIKNRSDQFLEKSKLLN
jgi:hypothetical protein